MINLTKEEQQQVDKIASKISLEKDKQILSEHVVNLSKCMFTIGQNSAVDLCGKTARVVVALDYSGSMNSLYKNGTIQETLNRLVPLGLSFDDNGELDVFLFQNDYKEFDALTLQNYADYKKMVIDKSGYSMGGTNYAPVLKAITAGSAVKTSLFTNLFSRAKSSTASEAANDITFVIFITDGEPSDRSATDDIIRKSSNTNTFIQFIGIGGSSFSYLEHLDELSGRTVDNTGFSCLNNLRSITDIELYNSILTEFAGWIKTKGL